MFNSIELNKPQTIRCQTKLSTYLKKLDSEVKQVVKLAEKDPLESADSRIDTMNENLLRSFDQSSVAHSTIDLGNEHETENMLYSLPLEE